MIKLTRCILTLTLIASLTACGDNANNTSQTTPPHAPPALIHLSPPVVFKGVRNDYTITRDTSGFKVTDKNGVSTTVASTGQIQFDNMRINLQIGDKANSIAPVDLRALIDLYIAFFNRLPDADGLEYWIDKFKAGMSIDQISQNFYAAALLYSAQTGYDATMTDADFVRVIYKNVLGRSGAKAPPDADVTYWANELKNGRSKGNLISTMLVSARSFTGNAEWGWVPQLLDNKVAVGTFFAVQQGINYNTPEESITKTMAIVAAITPATTSTAKDLIGVKDTQFNLTELPNLPDNSPGLDHQKTLIALINFPDNSAHTVSLEKVKDMIVNNPLSLNQFVKVNSNGRVSIDASFIDWTTLTKNSEYYFNQNDLKNNELHNDAISALSKVVDLRSIKRLILMVKDGFQGHPGCYAYQDKVTVGNASEYNGYLVVLGGYGMGCVETGRIAHEYGHTFGFGHSLESRCETTPPNSLIDLDYLNTCAIKLAYSGTYDTMGSDLNRPLFSSVWRAKAGWFNSDQIKTVTTSGIYTLEQSELSSNGTKLISVPLGLNEKGDMVNYYIEYRKKLGDYDTASFTQMGKEYEIVVRTDDLKGSTSDLLDFGKNMLNLGKNYVDVNRDFKVSVVSIDGVGSLSSVRLDIQVPRLAIKPSTMLSFKSSTELDKTLTVQNTSTNTVTVSSTGISGRNSDAFKVNQDQCSGVALAPNQSCSLHVTRVNQDSALAYTYIKFNNGESMRIVELKGNKTSYTPYDPTVPLEWQNIAVAYGKTVSWSEAISYCDNLELSGHSDWRLPRIEELRDAFQLSSKPVFTINDLFWSISEVESNPSNAYSIYGNGQFQWQNSSKMDKYNALCVRNK
ncbi:MAG: DUF4214 domain-containing protein [Burkholderiales bacterium]|nr:DUF4214 domain-containing protein [Burkholderiales bacterium]